MKNAVAVEAMSNDSDLQHMFFSLSTPEMRIDARIESSGIAANLRSISNQFQQDTSASVVSGLLRDAASQFSLDRVQALISEELGRFSANPLYNVPAQMVDTVAFSGLVLYHDSMLRVSLVAVCPMALRLKQASPISNKTRGTTVQGNDSLMCFLRAGGAILNIWNASPFEYDEPLAIRSLPPPFTQEIADGQCIFLEGGKKGLSIASCEAPLLFVLATRNLPRSPINAHYRSDTGELHSCTASEPRSTRIQLLATLLRELECTSGSSEIIGLIDHPDHFVRWHLMRELVVLAPNEAKPSLINMAVADPHPQVRDAARQTIKLLEEVVSCR